MVMLWAILGSTFLVPAVPASVTVKLERHRLRPEGVDAAARVLMTPIAETALRRPHQMPYDMAVVAEVSVGTPPQTLRVLLDTGSGDFWLPSSSCGAGAAGNHFLDQHASQSFAPVQRWNGAQGGGFVMRSIRYGYGQIHSMVVRDTVRFAGVEVPQQSFLLATQQQDFASQHLWDGILGLAFPQPFPDFAGSGQPLLTELGRRGVEPVLSFVPGLGSRHAELRIGRGSYEGVVGHNVTWIKSVSDKHWIVDAFVGISERKAQRMIVDTGTSLILMSPADFMATADALSVGQTCLLDKSGTRVFCSCANISTMPALKLYFGATTFVFNPEDIFEETGHPLGGGFDGELACELLVSVIPVHREEWILGDVFLRKVVTVFDFERGMVGFAAPKDDPRVQHRTTGTGSTLTAEVRWLPVRGGERGGALRAAKPSLQAWAAPRGDVGPSRTGPWRGAQPLAVLALLAAVLLLPLGVRRLRGSLRWMCAQPECSSASAVSGKQLLYSEDITSIE